MKRNIPKQLCVIVYEVLTALLALELALPSRRFQNKCIQHNINLEC